MAREAYIKKNITETLGLALKTLQQIHINSEEPIYSEDSANTVCNILEAVFLHGLKSSFSHKLSSYLIGVDHSNNRQPSYWELLTRFSHKDVVSQLNHLGQITTEIGMCRAWLRVALNDGLLESYLDAMLADKASIRHFYKRTAYLRDEEQAGILKSYSQGIQSFRFQLSYNSSVLNIWTTTPLVLAGLVEQTVTPRAAITTSASEGALSQAATAGAAEGNQNVEVVGARRVNRSRSSQPVIVSSRSHSGDLRRAAASPPTPPNTSYNPAALSSTEIEEIRKLTEQARGAGSASTPTSQISFPDYVVDGRFLTSPDELLEHRRSPSRSPTSQRGQDQERGAACADMPLYDELHEHKDMLIDADSSGAADGLMDSSQASPRHRNSSQPTGGSVNSARSTPGLMDSSPTTPSSMESLRAAQSLVDSPQATHSQTGVEPTMTASSKSDTPTPSATPENKNVDSGDRTRVASEEQVSVSMILPPHLQRRKSEVLKPVLTDVTASVEVAREVSPTTVIISASESERSETPTADMESQPYGIYDEYSPTPQGNMLGSMQGWSSEFQEPEVPFGQVEEESPAEVSLHREVLLTSSTQVESYRTMLQSYTPSQVSAASMSQVLENLSGVPEDATMPPQHTHVEEVLAEDYPDDYDILPVGLNPTSDHADSRTQHLASLIGQICNEKGLDQQNYQCNGCSRPIGMIYGKARDCAYDGCYYCYECHENDECIIPSRIVHNWDFAKHKVACHTMRFLKQVEEDPLLNVQHINPRLYDHVPEMKEVKEVRIQLRFLKAYLFTCKQSVADDLRKQVWPREYLYDDIHLYSVQDLLQIPTGQLVTSLRKVIKYASRHVYDCRLCSQKGFICEVCHSPKVIYPFQADTTCRCEGCNAVYHKDCKPSSSQCPKCERRKQRQMSLGSDLGEPDMVDYAYVE